MEEIDPKEFFDGEIKSRCEVLKKFIEEKEKNWSISQEISYEKQNQPFLKLEVRDNKNKSISSISFKGHEITDLNQSFGCEINFRTHKRLPSVPISYVDTDRIEEHLSDFLEDLIGEPLAKDFFKKRGIV